MQNMEDYSFETEGVIINVKNNDNRCFEYAILSALYKNEIKDNPENRFKYKKYIGKLDFSGIDFPVSLKDIDKFEKKILKLVSMYMVMRKGER